MSFGSGGYNPGPWQSGGGGGGGGGSGLNDTVNLIGMATNLLAAALTQNQRGRPGGAFAGGSAGLLGAPPGQRSLMGGPFGPGHRLGPPVGPGEPFLPSRSLHGHGGASFVRDDAPRGIMPPRNDMSQRLGWSSRGNQNFKRTTQQNFPPAKNSSFHKTSERKEAPKKTAIETPSSTKSVASTPAKDTSAKFASSATVASSDVKKGSDASEESVYDGLPPKLLHCSPCNKAMWNGISFERHLHGNAHDKMMELLADEHAKMVALMRQHIILMEGRREIVLEKLRKQGKKTPDVKSFCTMCDINIFGTLAAHRKSEGHQRLKEFLHPKCSVCNMEFTVRTDWDLHKLSVEHLKKMAAAGVEQEEKDYVDRFDFCQNKVSFGESEAEKGTTCAQADQEAAKIADDKVATYELPDFDGSKAVGFSFVKPVNGSFCRLCKKFLGAELVEAHLRSQPHYDKFAETINAKKTKVTETSSKRAANEDVVDDSGNWKRQRKLSEDGN